MDALIQGNDCASGVGSIPRCRRGERRPIGARSCMNRRALMIGLSGAAVAAGGGVAAWRSAAGAMAEYDAYSARLRASLSPPDVVNVIRFATLAANGHNTQPWRFRISDREIRITPDLSRRTPAVDPDDHHLYVSLG